MSKNKKQQYQSVFPLLSNTDDDGNNDMTKVEARFTWLIQTRTATQPVFALRLQHEEPADSFHPTMRAVLATSDDALDCWLGLEQSACERKLLALQAELNSVCREYKIMLKPVKDKYTFKFPHQKGRSRQTTFAPVWPSSAFRCWKKNSMSLCHRRLEPST